MAKTFDATLNSLIDAHVDDWAAFLATRIGIPSGPVTALDTDLSATLQADRLFRVDGPDPAAIHLELESSGRLGKPGDLLKYNVAAWGATGLLVHSVLVLLRPKANATDQTGVFELGRPGGRANLRFWYTVIRVWEESVTGLLDAGPGLAPLALLTNEAAADLPAAFGRFRERLQASGSAGNVTNSLFGSAFVLCGLRYPPDRIEALYRDLSMTLEDSTTYQLILNRGITQGRAEGRAEEAQAMVLRIGANRFGPAPAAVENAVRAIADCHRLERMADRLLVAVGWDDLLATG